MKRKPMHLVDPVVLPGHLRPSFFRSMSVFSSLVSHLSLRRRKRKEPAEPTSVKPPPMTNHHVTRPTEDIVNVDQLEFSASRDLALFLGATWNDTSLRKNLAAFPAFEYLLEQDDSATPSPVPPRRLSSKSRASTTSHRLSLYRPKLPSSFRANRPQSLHNFALR